MTDPARASIESAPLAFLARGGEMGDRTRAFDWSKTPVGPAAAWPQSLKIAVRIMLDSRYAMWLGWGPDFTFLYNDAYAKMTLGPKHPWALGRSAREVWPEIWGDIGPRAEKVIATGEPTWDEGLLLFLERRGFPEETYHTFSYSPIPGDRGGVGGMLCVVTEDTGRVIGERRLRTLRELASRTSEEAKSVEDATRSAARTLADNPHDLPFALIYLLDDDATTARLTGATGLPDGSPAAPPTVDLTGGDEGGWPFRAVLGSGHPEVVTELGRRFGPLPGRVWPEPPQQAVVVPMAKPGQSRPTGFVVAGVSPRLVFTDEYKGFILLLAGQVAAAVGNARAYEEERRRAEALAELDRAKTAFFSNVSHEFRTPLTLMLGPVEDLLARSHTDLPPAAAGQLEVVNRNGLRLLRLVNSLLDFSRIEAGRVRAVYQPTDLAAFTADLASNFRSACERAGLRLVVDCEPVGESVFVDREMWEKVVLNLVSNAFKFTFEGEVAVTVRRAGTAAELRVRDTGTGIPAEEMPRLFERFHRVEKARGRTHEGSGIGLALVQELVKLHGGTIGAESAVGKGTTFTITLPLGSAHLPPDQIGDGRTAATGTGATPYVEEALRWLPDGGPDDGRNELPTYHEPLPTPYRRAERNGGDDRPRVLVADDNADMRQYVVRLLAEQFRVEAVPDGEAALQAARAQPPDLILTDVMMPRLNGFGLLKELRADPRTSGLPIIMLSARAGEESRVEGMEAGADDYLVKPFSSRELLARVTAHLQMARLRREANEAVRRSEERFRAFMSHSPATAYIKDGEGRYVFVNRLVEETFQRPLAEWVGKTDLDIFPREQAEQYRDNDRTVLASRTTAQFVETVMKEDGPHHVLSFKFPLKDGEGSWLLAGMSLDITEKRNAEKALERERDRLRVTLASIGDAVITTDTGGRIAFLNGVAESLTGWANADAVGQPLAAVFDIVHEATRQPVENPAARALREGVVVGLANHTVLIRKDGTERPIDDSAAPVRDGEGHVVGCVLVFRDVTERRRLEKQAVEQAEAARKLAAIVDSSEDAIISKTLDGIIQSWNAAAERIFGYTAAEAVGRHITMLFPADRLEEEDRIIARIRAGERVEHFDTVRLRKDGTAIPISLTISPIRDEEGRIVGASKIARDITERTVAEAALRHSEGRLAAELEATTRLHDLSIRLLSATDLTTALDDVLENAVQTCGADFGNIQLFNLDTNSLEIVVQRGFRSDFLDYFRTVRVDEGSACAQAMQSGERIVIEDVELDPAFAPHRRIAAAAGFRAVASTPLTAHDGAVVGMLSVHFRFPHRVSERDGRLLDLYARHAADLIERLRLMDKLRHVAAELSEANRKKDEFLATLAHELRNPLAPLRNALQIIRLSPDRDAREQARGMMERQLGQMVRLVDDLMDVSRITRGKVELRKERVQLSAVVASAVETSRPLVEQMGHELTVRLTKHPVVVEADPTRLAQVFANLLNNAAKYSDRGGHIRLTAGRQGGDVVVSVRDTGIGIPPDKLTSIFDMFSQVDRSLEKAQGGLGIGLTLVRRLFEMHDGRVEARSEGAGRGAEFVVRLPAVVEAPVPEREDDEPAAPQSSLRILIVDDNRDGADSLAMMLRLMGNDTATAYDGQEGLDMAGRLRPDVVLLDIGLPKLNGYEAARRIREQPWGRHPVMIAVTGWGQEEDRRRSHEAGFDHHLVKPVDPNALMRLLTELRAGTA
jgi:PAS domain S-box-containing protein